MKVELEKTRRNVAHGSYEECVALELFLSSVVDSSMSCYRKTIPVRLDEIINLNATLTGLMSLRRISVAFLMCTTMESSPPDPVSMSRVLGRGGGLG